MSVGIYCNREVVVAPQESSVAALTRLMREFHVGDVIIVEPSGEANRPLGIVTDRDIVIELLSDGIDLESVAAGDVMSANLLLLDEGEEILAALEKMRDRGVRRAPVVDGDGLLLGLLTVDDLVELFAEQLTGLATLVKREQSHEQKLRP